MCVSDIVNDIVKSTKGKPKNYNLCQKTLKEYFSYDKATGILKFKKASGNKDIGYIVNEKRIVFRGYNLQVSKLIWCYVKGVYPTCSVYMKNLNDGYKFDNLTLQYKESSHGKNSNSFTLKTDYNSGARKKSNGLPSQSLLKYHFRYENGLLLWRKTTGNFSRVGSPAGYVNDENRRIITLKNRTYDSELLINIYLNGDVDKYVDHSRKKRFKYEKMLDFDYMGNGIYKSYKNGDIVNVKNGCILDV